MVRVGYQYFKVLLGGSEKKPEISQLVSQQLVFKTKACHIQRGSTKRCTEKFVLIATYTNLKVWNTVPR